MFVLLLLSCYLSSYFEDLTVKSTIEIAKESDLARLASMNGSTFGENDLKVTFGHATQNDFDRAGMKFMSGFEMAIDDARKIDGTIHLKIAGNWKAMESFNDLELDGTITGDCTYLYLGKNDTLKNYLIGAADSYGFEWYLIDQMTGAISTVNSEPIISPDHTMFITLENAANSNMRMKGFHIWKVDFANGKKTMKRYFVARNQDWIPYEMYWESKSSILIKALPMVKYDSMKSVPLESDFTFVRMIVKPRNKVLRV